MTSVSIGVSISTPIIIIIRVFVGALFIVLQKSPDCCICPQENHPIETRANELHNTPAMKKSPYSLK